MHIHWGSRHRLATIFFKALHSWIEQAILGQLGKDPAKIPIRSPTKLLFSKGTGRGHIGFIDIEVAGVFREERVVKACVRIRIVIPKWIWTQAFTVSFLFGIPQAL